MKITIPPAALETGARAIFKIKNPDLEWENCDGEIGSAYAQAQRKQARAAFTAMVEAWPGMQHRIYIEQALILPLTENPDAEA